MNNSQQRQAVIRIAAAIVFNVAGHVLLVRKRGSAVFMQPGGKIEPGETPLAALARELREEPLAILSREHIMPVARERKRS